MRAHSRSSFIVSTTSTIEGAEITSYHGVVSSHVVAGTGFFSDLFASFSDVFGGRSGTYQRQLATIHEEAISQLRERAARLGANAVVGLSLDHDEISGGGKSMFMVTATGTAVTISRPAGHPATNGDGTSPEAGLSAEDLSAMVRRQNAIALAREGRLLFSEATWKFLCEERIHEVAEAVAAEVRNYTDAYYPQEPEALKWARLYYGCIPEEIAVRHAYEILVDDNANLRKFAEDLLKTNHLIDFKAVANLLAAKDLRTRKRALLALGADKRQYGPEDIATLDWIISYVTAALPRRGRIVEVDRTFSSKKKQAWECECGTTNDMDRPYCRSCSYDIDGFAEGERKPAEFIARLKAQRDVLASYFGAGPAAAGA